MIAERETIDEGPITIDLAGPDGNAFVLMARARQYGKQLGMSKEDIAEMIDEMKASDYENLIRVFDLHFGEYVTLIRP